VSEPAEAARHAPAHMWAPLRVGVFRMLWLGVLASNIGLWMQTVGAQWLLVSLPHAAILISLVQTADMLPDVLFGVVGGVLADIFDRRRLLIVVQVYMVVNGLALTVLTIAGQLPPALLLTFTFLLGAGSVLTLPAYQSVIPDVVPREQLRDAATLSSVGVNLARAVGPAVGGVLIARAGVSTVFAVNAAMNLLFLIVVVVWHPAPRPHLYAPEPFVSALRAGARYVRYSPVTRRILLRAALFLVPATALWALLPLIATRRLGLGAGGYGILLAALGIGAVLGSFFLGSVRDRMSNNQMIAAASVVYAGVMAVLALVRSAPIALVVLLAAGVTWIAVISTVNATLQLFLPQWVRARGLSIYLTVLFGSQAIGAVVWGVLADTATLVPTLLIAAGVMVVAAATIRVWPLQETTGLDRSVAAAWPQPQLVVDTDPQSGPVVVRTIYTVAPEHEEAFLGAMARVRLSRLRTGGTQWGLFRDGEVAHRFVELFVVPSWDEHLRQHEGRLTGADREIDEAPRTLSDPPPETAHWIATEVD
jgi:predicted MFS family arabinose efflux permease